MERCFTPTAPVCQRLSVRRSASASSSCSPGEKIVGEPQIGDSVRWNLAPALYGNGEEATSVIVLKPQSAGLDTNLLVTTDRRAYYLRLISKPEDYVARVAFAYPDGDERKWQAHLASNGKRRKERAAIAN